ncbi:MAG: TldD/PmbA family protein [Isosphaeraceae bacterium]
MSWTSDQARALTDRILSFSRARECEVTLRQSEAGHTRFAANEITTSGMLRTVTIGITRRDGGRRGTTTTDAHDDWLLRAAVARSEALMAAARPDPEQVEGLGPQHYPEIPAFDEATAVAGPVRRRDGVKAALDRARGRGLDASGFFENGARWSAIANKKGNFGFHRATAAEYSSTMRTVDGTGSGYARLSSPRLSDIDPVALSGISAHKAETSARPRELKPGAYTVILEPAAVADLLMWLTFSLDARTADEGRSFLSKPGGGNRIGEKLFADGVTLRSDPFDPRNPGTPWALGGFFGGPGSNVGVPARKTTWIENGVVRALAVDRYWAGKTKVEPVPLSGGLSMEGSEKSLDALIAETERALLVTRFWYIRYVNPRTVMVTGLTRDGVWLIEKGKVVHPVNNFRFNDSPVDLLKNLEATSVATPAGSEFFPMLVPAIRARDFHFTSKSDAV